MIFECFNSHFTDPPNIVLYRPAPPHPPGGRKYKKRRISTSAEIPEIFLFSLICNGKYTCPNTFRSPNICFWATYENTNNIIKPCILVATENNNIRAKSHSTSLETISIWKATSQPINAKGDSKTEFRVNGKTYTLSNG